MREKNNSCFVGNCFTGSSNFLHQVLTKKKTNTGETVGHRSEIKGQIPCEYDYEKLFLNGVECFYLCDEDIVALNVKDCMEENVVKSKRNGARLQFNKKR